MPFDELDLSNIKTYKAAERPSKVTIHLEAKPLRAGMTVRLLLDRLPDILKAADLKAVATAVVKARQLGRPVIAMIGGHVIKTGCSPIWG